MAGNRPDFINQMLEMWGRLEGRQRITIIAFAALGLILVVSVVYYANRVEYQTLYRDLTPDDAQAIVARLEESRRSYRVKGTSILVAAPKEDIDKLRLEFSGAGLGRSGLIGYEVFDKSQFGMTDFTEQINLQRALEGELARTISRLAEISNARVHIVLPKDSYFEASRERAKASVVLTLRNGAMLSRSSIAGIRGVVAGAVPGLNSQNVSIVDDEGRVLAQSLDAGDINRSELELEMSLREQTEKDLAAKAAAILEPVFGRKNVQVNASVEIDTNVSEQTEELFTPNPQAVVSHQRLEERAGGNLLDMGVPGTQSNVGTAAASSILTGPDRFRESETTNYEVSKTVRHTVQPKGSIRRLSVAVTLNNRTVVTKGQDGSLTTSGEPISERELDDYRQLVMAAVGYNELRGDVVTVRNAPFYDETALLGTFAAPWYVRIQNQEIFVPLIKYLTLFLVLALIYLVFVRPLRRHVIQAIDASAPQPALPPAEENLLLESGAVPAESALPGAGMEESALPGLPEAQPEPEMPAFDMLNATEEQIEDMLANEELTMGGGSRRYAVMKKKMIDKARKNPELVSQLIRSMMQGRA
jgi:flagellar M-ring protein FliF